MAKNTENVTEVQMSPEETKANVRMYEDAQSLVSSPVFTSGSAVP